MPTLSSKWFSTLLASSRPRPSPRAGPRPFDRVFRRFDADGDGKISAEELQSCLSSTGGEQVSAEWARRAVAGIDSDGDGMIGYEDFVRVMEDSDDDDDAEDVRSAFEMYQGETGSGCITPQGLQRMLARLQLQGDAPSYGDCAAMIRAYDLNGDGVLDYSEFHRMMTRASC